MEKLIQPMDVRISLLHNIQYVFFGEIRYSFFTNDNDRLYNFGNHNILTFFVELLDSTESTINYLIKDNECNSNNVTS